MKVQFHIYLTNKNSRRLQAFRRAVILNVCPLVKKLARAAELTAFFIALFAASSLETAFAANARSFVLSLLVISASELLYHVSSCLLYNQSVKYAARRRSFEPIVITQHTYRQRSTSKRLARHAA